MTECSAALAAVKDALRAAVSQFECLLLVGSGLSALRPELPEADILRWHDLARSGRPGHPVDAF